MRIAIVLPYLPDLSGASGTSGISGASLSLWVFLRRYANAPEVKTLELFLAPRDLLQADSIRRLAAEILKPDNFGKGKLEIHSIYALPDVWADGEERVIHTDDLHALARDRDLRDRYAVGPTVIACDTHCMGHRSIVDSLRLLVRAPQTDMDRIYATTEPVARSIRATFDALRVPDHTTVELVPRMIETSGLNPCVDDQTKRAIRSDLELPKEGVIGLVAGRMTPATKGDLIAITEIFAENSGPGHYLLFAGHEEYVGYSKIVREVANRLQCGSRVLVRGGFGIGARGDLYRACDFLVFPADSGNEVFGQVSVEAMASGLPVLGTDWDGLKDTVEHGVTGFKIPTFSPPRLGRFDGLSSAIDDTTSLLMRAQATVVDRAAFGRAFFELFGNHELRLRMGSAAANVFKARFDPDQLFAQRMRAFRHQLDRAALETSDVRSKRRAWANSNSLEVPLFEQYEDYGSGQLLAPNRVFHVTASGSLAFRSRISLQLFPEVSVVVPPAVLELLLSELETAKTSEEILTFAERSQTPTDLILFGLAVLCKRGYVSVETR